MLYSDGCIEIEINQKINENESLIKELLQETSEDLSDFLFNVKKKGIIKDDISILRIQYNKVPQLKIIQDSKEMLIPLKNLNLQEIKEKIQKFI